MSYDIILKIFSSKYQETCVLKNFTVFKFIYTSLLFLKEQGTKC